jgi:asparagine synthase (glutamine-hydrolysing)
MTPVAVDARPDSPTRTVAGRWTISVDLELPGRLRRDAPTVSRADLPGLQILFDGVLFDVDDVRRLTAQPPESTAADLVLALYSRLGEDGLATLRGTFAFVLLDAHRERLIAVRDPIGLHPFYYREGRGHVTFAASPLALISGGAELNAVALADHLCNRWPDPEETFFAGVRRVLPGTRVVVTRGRLVHSRYWDPLPGDTPIQWHTRDEVERFDHVFGVAVDRCLSTGPSGIFLSGGLDSISVAAAAADRARARGLTPPIALSLGFDDPSCDERPTQRAAAATLGLDHTIIGFDEALGDAGLFEQALALNRRWPFPLNNTWNPAYMALAARGRDAGVRTILTGTGGDEWLTVSAFLAADLIRSGDVAGLARFARSWGASYPVSIGRVARRTLWTFGLRPLVSRQCYRAAPAAWDRRRLRRLLQSDPDWVAPDRSVRQEQERRGAACVPAADPRHGFYLREMRSGLDHAIVTMELEERHEVGQRLGMRFLHPFWDPDVVELLFRTPPALLDRDGRSKGLIRQTLARRFPQLGFDGQKKVAATSFHQSLMQAEAARLREIVGPLRSLPALGVVDAAKATAAIDQAFATGRQMHRAWSLLNLETWTRAHVR